MAECDAEPSGVRQVVRDPTMDKSGVYWSWNEGLNNFENQLSGEASDPVKAGKLWDISTELVGL